MEPVEEYIDTMLDTAKILSRLFVNNHITSEELAMLQQQLMKPQPQPVFIGTPNYMPPSPSINPWIHKNSGTFYIDTNNPFSGIGVLNSHDSHANYLVLK